MKKNNPLDVIDAMLKDHAPKRPDEFSVYDYVARAKEQGITVAIRTAGIRLAHAVSRGELVARRTVINGKCHSVYRKP